MMRLGEITNRELAPLRGGHLGSPSELHRKLVAAKRTLVDGNRESDLANNLCAEDLRELSDEIGSLVPVSCDGGSLGYLNPKNAFNLKYRCGALPGDYASSATLKEAAAELSRLWGNDVCATGMNLARNAVLLAVLDDPELRSTAIDRARSWLSGLHGRIDATGCKLT